MRAVAFTKPLPISDAAALIDVEVDRPEPGPRDLLVRVAAVSVNPVDFKVRKRDDPGGKPRLLGYDAAGTVEAVGAGVTFFKPGEAVYYAGSVLRPGTNAEYHLVDERIAGAKPKSLDFAEAAALPLTALTAWELLFDRIGIGQGAGADKRSLLIVGGAGGVGSIAIQLARALTGLTVIATASRPETVDWVKSLGAHHVVDHSKPLAPQLEKIGIPAADIVVALAGTKGHVAEIADFVAPQGHIGMIEGDGAASLGADEFGKLFQKCVGLHFEFMFARSRFGTPDMVRQHEILEAVAALVDQGKLRTTLMRRLSPINAATMREAHAAVESGKSIGKIVVEGWDG
jgi:zinc-binding alcohol dehydrogenase family protein